MVDMLIKPLNWNSLEEVMIDMKSCLYDLQNFRGLYETEDMPIIWERYIKEGFKNYMTSFLELCKALMYYSKPQGRMKYTSFYEAVRDYEGYRILPLGSSKVLDDLRQLRNKDSHGYYIPEFSEMYQIFTDNEYLFVSIVESGKSLLTKQKENKTTKMKLGD